MSNETVNLREVPITKLSKQQIKSRLHIIQDDKLRLQAELAELDRMEDRLTIELEARND